MVDIKYFLELMVKFICKKNWLSKYGIFNIVMFIDSYRVFF